ncbi:MAG: biotin-dependent carboxyltransferase family protein [Boseongicola sp.]
MTARLHVLEAGPGLCLQDLGRPGRMGIGLSPGGAIDSDALLRGHALLGNVLDAVALEMAGFGGRFRFEGNTRVALTGAVMRATLNDEPVIPNVTYSVADGDDLRIGPAVTGVYGYLHIKGGFQAEAVLGGCGYHGIANLGSLVCQGDVLAAGSDPALNAPELKLPAAAPSNAPIRVMDGPQTSLFPEDVRARFEAAHFIRSAKGNRQGIRLDHDGEPYSTGGQLKLASDFIAAGDIQMTGDGTPFVLLADCQTMGGYPRIGTVLPADLPRIAQAQPGTEITFRFVTLEEAGKSWKSAEERLDSFQRLVSRLVRDPHEMRDLLGYEFISRPIDN